MKILFFILLSFIYVFGGTDPEELELPSTVRACTTAEQAACGAGIVCRIDYDNIRHCVGASQDTGAVYPETPNVVNGRVLILSGYR